MKNLSKNGLSDLQLIAMIFIAMAGANIIYLPRVMAEKAGRDGWISIIMAGGAVFLAASFVYLLCRRFPHKTLGEFSILILGKPLGILVSTFYVIYALLLAGINMRIFVEVARTWTMFWTPMTVFIVLLLVPAFYIVRQGIVPLGRLAELIIFTSLFLSILLILPVAQFSFIHLKPMGQEGLLSLAGAAPRAFFAYLGYEALMVIYPFVASRGKVYRLYILSIGLAVIFFTGTTLLVYGASGVEHTRLQIWPLMEYLATGRLLFVERIDNLFLFVMTAKIIVLVALQYYAASVTVAAIISKKLFGLWTLVLLPVLFAAAFWPRRQYETFDLAARFGPWGFAFIMALVLILLLVAVIRGLDERKEETGQ